MSVAAIAMPLISKDAPVAMAFDFEVKNDIIATSRELTMLQECARFLHSHAQYRAHIEYGGESNHMRFIKNTLMHLDVPSDRIVFDYRGPRRNGAAVTLRMQACQEA